MCRERDSNPHGHFWPRDFKSLVSTNSTIAALRHVTVLLCLKHFQWKRFASGWASLPCRLSASVLFVF